MNLFFIHRRFFQKFLRDTRGIALVEFVITLPVLLILIFGTIELFRFVLIEQKIDRTISSIDDVVTQQSAFSTIPLFPNQMANLMGIAQTMMQPFPFGASGKIILTDFTAGGVQRWKYCSAGGLNVPSRLNGALPPGLTLFGTDEVVIGEIFFQFTPITPGNIIPSTVLYSQTAYTPRNHVAPSPSLANLTPTGTACP